MDLTEDLSARVLLKHILTTETPRTPITRSETRARSTSATRRSSRLANKDAGGQTPQDILRRSLKQKMRASITRKSLPSTKRRTTSAVHRKTNTPAPSSVPLGDGDTPRHILMNILRTEPVRTPVVHEKAASEPQNISANSSITSKHSSSELSGLDFPDITISNVVSTAKGLSRKRPHRSLNVTAFEKRLKEGDDVEEETGEPVAEHSSLSLSSSTSLSLKTPFVDVGTEKRGLQRRVSNRRKITEEEFGAAVIKRQMGGVSSLLERGLSETAYSEGFTLGLSNLSEPDITTDIVHCNTALFAHPDAMSSNFSIVATQDKATVMASQLQRQMIGLDQKEQIKERSLYVFPTEKGTKLQDEDCFSLTQSEDDVNAAESEKGGEKRRADDQPENAAAVSKSEEEEGPAELQGGEKHDMTESEGEENRVETQIDEEVAADSQTEEGEIGVDYQSEEDVVARCQSEEEEVSPNTQTEGLEGVASQPGEEEGATDSQTQDEEGAGDSQTEEPGDVVSQSEEGEVAPDTQTEEGAVDSQTKELGAIDSQFEEEEDPADSFLPDFQSEDGHDGKCGERQCEQASEQLEQDLEHVSRRAHRSEGGVMLVTEAGEDLSNAGSKYMAGSSTPGQTEAEADKENSFHLSIEGSRELNHDSAEEAAAQDFAEQEEDWDDDEVDGEESEEIPSKTPAFVREKRNLFHPDPLASPSVLRNVQASTSGGFAAPKPKQVKKRTQPAKKEGSLPKSYLMSVFKHFAKTKVSADVYPVLEETMDKFFSRLAEDLETYATHAKRKTLEVEDAELLLKRQGHVNDKVPVEVLIEKYLRMDQRKLLIPIATSGNVVIPKKRR